VNRHEMTRGEVIKRVAGTGMRGACRRNLASRANNEFTRPELIPPSGLECELRGVSVFYVGKSVAWGEIGPGQRLRG
jgi:hypothetical protein